MKSRMSSHNRRYIKSLDIHLRHPFSLYHHNNAFATQSIPHQADAKFKNN